MDDFDGGSATSPADLPTFTRKPPPMKLNRQGTFKQGSKGSVDLVDISQSPRSSRSGSRTLDRATLEQIQRIKLDDDITPEQLEHEVDDAFDQMPLSPRSSNGSNSSTPRSVLSQAKPALVLKRQGTFVQRRDGQTDQMELTSGAKTKGYLSIDSTKILHETINDDDDDDYDDDGDFEASGDDTVADDPPAVAISEEVAVPEPEPADGDDDNDDANDNDDAFAMAPPPVVMTTGGRKFGHNRKGTFLQNSNGKAVALNMSGRAAPTVTSDEILSREMSASPDPIEEDFVEDDDCDDGDLPLVDISRSRPKPPPMERKGTFIQSKSGTTASLQLGSASTTEMTARRLSNHGLEAILGDNVASETSPHEQTDSPNTASERVRMGSLNSNELQSSESELLTSSGCGDASSDTGLATSTESPTPIDAAAELPLSLVFPEPLMQRKATYIQTASGHTTTLRMTAEPDVAESIIPAAIEFIEETDHESGEDESVVAPLGGTATNRVDQSKRQAYLKNRKGTFAANENGKMVQVTLGGSGGRGIDDPENQQISLGALAQIVDEVDEDQVADDDNDDVVTAGASESHQRVAPSESAGSGQVGDRDPVDGHPVDVVSPMPSAPITHSADATDEERPGQSPPTTAATVTDDPEAVAKIVDKAAEEKASDDNALGPIVNHGHIAAEMYDSPPNASPIEPAVEDEVGIPNPIARSDPHPDDAVSPIPPLPDAQADTPEQNPSYAISPTPPVLDAQANTPEQVPGDAISPTPPVLDAQADTSEQDPDDAISPTPPVLNAQADTSEQNPDDAISPTLPELNAQADTSEQDPDVAISPTPPVLDAQADTSEQDPDDAISPTPPLPDVQASDMPERDPVPASDPDDLNGSASKADMNRRGSSIGKRVQISSDVVVIGSSVLPSSIKTRSATAPIDVNIQRMLETAERDRVKRSRQLRQLEKSRMRSRSLHYQTNMMPASMTTTSLRTVQQQQQQLTTGDEQREKILRPTTAEKFVQTYRVYAPIADIKATVTLPKVKGAQRRKSAVP